MSKRLRTVMVAASVVASMLGGAWSPAVAGGIYKTDGNDTAGPLDLASMRLTPVGGSDRFQIRAITPFTSGQLNGDDGWFEVDFDTNADRKYDFWTVVLYSKGKLFAILGRGKNVLRKLDVRRVDPRTVAFDLARRTLGSVSSYDFVVYSVWRAKPCSSANVCVDTIPNKYPLLRRDFTPPTITWGPIPLYTSDVSATLDYDVHFSVHDDRNGSGVKRWTLQQQTNGGSWTTVATGTVKNVTESVTSGEGEVTLVRVLVVDRQGNRRTSRTKRTVAPWDDRNAVFDYSSAPTLADGLTGPFLGTTSTMAQGTVVTATLPAGSTICVLGGPTSSGMSATALLSVGGVPTTTVNESDVTTYRSEICTGAGTGGGAVISLEVTSPEPFVIDGLLLLP